MMQKDPLEKKDPSFLFSLNLMVLGGTLLLFVMISLNKLMIHYLSGHLNQTNQFIYKIALVENETFKIYNERELYLTWFSFSLSFIGLVIVLSKLVKTWKN
jgi:hypothetical protein